MADHTPTPLQEFLDDPDVKAFEDIEPITVKIGYVDDFTLDIGDLRDLQNSHDVLVKAIRDACDLLAERTYGGNARSPGHNARLLLEAALQDAGR